MKRYEISIQTKQPPCGGKSPTRAELMEADLEDPVGFAAEREPGLTLSSETNGDGDLVVSGEKGSYRVTYVFTEI